MHEPVNPVKEAQQPDSIESLERAQLVLFLFVTIAAVLAFVPLMATHSTGFTATLAIPITIGAICGALVPNGLWLLLVVGVMGGVGALVIALWIGHIAGLFCGLVFAAVGISPAMLAGLCVLSWRRARRRTEPPSTRSLLLLIALPYVSFGIESLVPFEPRMETLEVSRTIAAPVARVWGQSLGFGDRQPSAWQRVDAPLPESSSGRATRIGDRKRIEFGKGHILARVVEVKPGRRLVAEVLEQTIEVKALRLRRVVVTCEPAAAERTDAEVTKASLAIEFEPLMRPRWYLRLFEPFFGGIAMEAVMDAWQGHAEQRTSVVHR